MPDQRRSSRLQEIFGGICLLAIVLTILANIFSRAVLNKPLIWSVEISSVFIIWAIYALFGVNYEEEKHFTIDLLDEVLSPRTLKALDIMRDVVIVITLGFSVYYGIGAMERNMSVRTGAMGAPVAYVFYLPYVLGCLSMLYYVARKYHSRFSAAKREKG